VSTEDRYFEAVRALPPPTARQTALFASYVLAAESWYRYGRRGRRLPLGEEILIHVFLDHSTTVREHLGRNPDFLVETNWPDMSDHHYQWLFGFWNWDVCRDPVVHSEGAGRSLEVCAGKWLASPIPRQVLALGRAEVSSAAHYWVAQSVRWAAEDSDGTRLAALDKYLRQLAASARDAVDLPEPAPEFVQPLTELAFAFPVGAHPFALVGTEIWSTSADPEKDLFPLFLEHLEVRSSRQYLEEAEPWNEAWEVDRDSLIALFVQERLRQHRALKSAMSRVVEAVYGEAGKVS
jgi:hypothetical protein